MSTTKRTRKNTTTQEAAVEALVAAVPAPLTMAERFAALAEKSAFAAQDHAEASMRHCVSADARAAKRAKRECERWVELTIADANRAQGALACQIGDLDAPMPVQAEAAVALAKRALEAAQEAYRELKGVPSVAAQTR